MRKLQRGPAVPFLGGPLPVRLLVALGIFVAAFLVVLLVLWTMLGGIGLGLGWIVAMAAGLLAVKVYADRAPGDE